MTGLSYELTSCSLDTFPARLASRHFFFFPRTCSPTQGLLHAEKVGNTRRKSGVLTADFHAAKSRRLRHWFAALREGCGPGPPRHDPIPDSLSAWETDLLNGRTGRFAEPSHPKRMTVNEEHYIYRKTGRKRSLYPTIISFTLCHRINYPLIPHQQPITTSFINNYSRFPFSGPLKTRLQLK